MQYLDFLDGLHHRLEVPTYLEIGIKEGRSLALSRSPRTIAVDPHFRITHELACEPTLVRATSDDYFARPDALAPFGGEPVGLAFIDGMHLFEFALRDFINVERYARWRTVVAFDDIFPRWAGEAVRERYTTNWTGDVYKVWLVLQRYRPELICLPVNTMPTGLLLVLGCDAHNSVLADQYAEIEAVYKTPDPQDVPLAILDRAGALDPERLLASPIWSLLRDGRQRDLDPEEGLRQLRTLVDATVAGATVDFATTPLERPPLEPLPTPPPAAARPRRTLRGWLARKR